VSACEAISEALAEAEENHELDEALLNHALEQFKVPQ